jgi:hypothetical protein
MERPAGPLSTARCSGHSSRSPNRAGRFLHRLVKALSSAQYTSGLVPPAKRRKRLLPTGFKGYGVKTRAVKGHEFGLGLSTDDKKALIAFLKTL